MTVQDRISLIRLYNMLEENREYAEKLGVNIKFKMKKEETQKKEKKKDE